MSSKPREWPNVAKEARDRSAEIANDGYWLMRDFFQKDFTDTEKLRRYAKAMDSFQQICRILESVGAETRPF